MVLHTGFPIAVSIDKLLGHLHLKFLGGPFLVRDHENPLVA